MAAPAGNIYSGALAASTTTAAPAFAVAKRLVCLEVTVYSHYAATAATTGVDLLVQYSIDGGVSYSDAVTLGIPTTPTVSSVSPVSSQKYKAILNDSLHAVTHIIFSVKNLDATNAANDVEVLAVPVTN